MRGFIRVHKGRAEFMYVHEVNNNSQYKLKEESGQELEENERR